MNAILDNEPKPFAPKITTEQGIVLTGFTGIACVDFAKFQEDVVKRLGRTVFVHELGERKTCEAIRDLYRDDFMAMVTA